MSDVHIHNNLAALRFDSEQLARYLSHLWFDEAHFTPPSDGGYPVIRLVQSQVHGHERHVPPVRALRAAQAVQDVLGKELMFVHLEPAAVQLTFYDARFLGLDITPGGLGLSLSEMASAWRVIL